MDYGLVTAPTTEQNPAGARVAVAATRLSGVIDVLDAALCKLQPAKPQAVQPSRTEKGPVSLWQELNNLEATVEAIQKRAQRVVELL